MRENDVGVLKTDVSRFYAWSEDTCSWVLTDGLEAEQNEKTGLVRFKQSTVLAKEQEGMRTEFNLKAKRLVQEYFNRKKQEHEFERLKNFYA